MREWVEKLSGVISHAPPRQRHCEPLGRLKPKSAFGRILLSRYAAKLYPCQKYSKKDHFAALGASVAKCIKMTQASSDEGGIIFRRQSAAGPLLVRCLAVSIDIRLYRLWRVAGATRGGAPTNARQGQAVAGPAYFPVVRETTPHQSPKTLAWSCSSVAEDDQPAPAAPWSIRSCLAKFGN